MVVIRSEVHVKSQTWCFDYPASRMAAPPYTYTYYSGLFGVNFVHKQYSTEVTLGYSGFIPYSGYRVTFKNINFTNMSGYVFRGIGL